MFGDTTLFGQERWSATDLAQTLSLSVQRINQLVKEGIIPAPIDGRYQPRDAVSAYVRHLREQKSGSSKAGEEIKKIQLENTMREIRLRKIAGELAPIGRVEKDFFELARRIRDALLNLPARLSGPFSAEKNQEKIFEVFTEEIHQVLRELSSGPTAGHAVSAPRQSPGETDALDQVSTSPPADPTFDEAFLDRDRGADDQNDRFQTGD